jgi:DNA-binding response OmpR family regulator
MIGCCDSRRSPSSWTSLPPRSPLWRDADSEKAAGAYPRRRRRSQRRGTNADTLIQRGHGARVAVSAAHASMLVSTERPDVILLDINLPDSAGTLTLGRLRELRPDVPIIMLTANTDDELARATLKRGAFDYISKPFNIDHLVHVVEVALASSRKATR